jgi:polyhydroxyalkanoate synthesis repressor PhaR
MTQPKEPPIIIKKYANRRMYDTTNSRYVNLQQIAVMIKDGFIITVVDIGSGEDLTKVVLTQIILEEEKGQHNILPVEFMHELIKHGESASGDFLHNFLASGLEAYEKAQSQVTNAFQQWMTPVWPETNKEEPKDNSENDERESLDEVESLKERLAQLEARLSKKGR